jgi:hypothetical protein
VPISSSDFAQCPRVMHAIMTPTVPQSGDLRAEPLVSKHYVSGRVGKVKRVTFHGSIINPR